MERLNQNVNKDFWRGKRVFLTGHTGFKGSWLSLWLQDMGAVVKGYSLAPQTENNLFEVARVSEGMISEIGDIRNLEQVTESMVEFQPEILIHMAAQPLVRISYTDPVGTYQTNVMGTLHVLEAAKKCATLKSIVAVTTDKCYENKEWVWGYRENEPMGGHDPYSSSKGCCELLISSYRNSYFNDAKSPNLASARAGNVIGGGDWSEDRLIPDILKAFEKSESVVVRNPSATRPWQHVLEPLSGYLMLAERLYNQEGEFAEPWNFGPNDEDAQSVESILNQMVELWGGTASWNLDPGSHPHEANLLKLDCSKANVKLKWQPKWTLNQTLSKIVEWHKQWLAGSDIRNYTLKEIKKYYNPE